MRLFPIKEFRLLSDAINNVQRKFAKFRYCVINEEPVGGGGGYVRNKNNSTGRPKLLVVSIKNSPVICKEYA